MKFKLALQLFKNMGFRYVAYRIHHELEKRLGVLKNTHPINPICKNYISLEEWRQKKPDFVIPEVANISFEKNPNKIVKDNSNRILKGELCFFNQEWKYLGKDYDWLTNPDSGYRYDISKHWSEIPDFSKEAGDIKYVWEKSRFTYFLTIIRNDFHFEEDHSGFVFLEMESWIDANPINQGPNWKCSQEIALRIINWTYVLNFYKNSKSLTEDRWNKIQNVIYWSLHHVYTNIDFSRIAVRNNHAITETLLLTISEMLFPFFTDTKIWAQKGRKWLEQEVSYQIYEDGTFLQFSMNYHRVVVQLLSLGIVITEKHKKPFSDTFYNRASASLDFLYQCLQEENGYLPNYGSNDGALFFPLTNRDYMDYRPQLNTLHYVLKGKYLYEDLEIKEDANWVASNRGHLNIDQPSIEKKFGKISFAKGGYYILREVDTFTFIRCGKHKDRPAHADNLHVDIWNKGVNVLRDSGTYKYNTEKEFQDYFTGTASHNTVIVDGYGQMLKGSRFIWFYWTQSKKAKWTETETNYIFEGTISAFRFLNPRAEHHRKLIKNKNNKIWNISDRVDGLPNRVKTQIWHYDTNTITFGAFINTVKVNANPVKSYYSNYYGIKETGKATTFTFENEIQTIITIKDKKITDENTFVASILP